jgi:hypothetical protein
VSLADCRSQMIALLNRRDCNTTLANTFLSQGLARIQRQLRVPSMERAISEVATDVPVQSFLVPQDLLQVIDVYANGLPLQKVAYRQIAGRSGMSPTDGPYDGTPGCGGSPKFYSRMGASIFLTPFLPVGGEVMVTYYGAFLPLIEDTDENEITITAPELLVYAGLSFGSDYFMMDQKAAYEARFQSLLGDVQDEADQLENTGGSMTLQSPYGCY